MHTFLACDQCDVRTSFCKQNSKYNYTCDCRPGFTKNIHGECEDSDECRSFKHNCGENSWCINTIGGFTCECKEGYIGDGKKCTFVGIGTSTDDCSQCSKNAECKNGVCQCRIGFKGDRFNCTGKKI
uniref:EGF-like domain-containing protein n=1 Tax=Panagrolaimus davidi TaxID=227884 RepID=A0A914PH11_9BILA